MKQILVVLLAMVVNGQADSSVRDEAETPLLKLLETPDYASAERELAQRVRLEVPLTNEERDALEWAVANPRLRPSTREIVLVRLVRASAGQNAVRTAQAILGVLTAAKDQVDKDLVTSYQLVLQYAQLRPWESDQIPAIPIALLHKLMEMASVAEDMGHWEFAARLQDELCASTMALQEKQDVAFDLLVGREGGDAAVLGCLMNEKFADRLRPHAFAVDGSGAPAKIRQPIVDLLAEFGDLKTAELYRSWANRKGWSPEAYDGPGMVAWKIEIQHDPEWVLNFLRDDDRSKKSELSARLWALSKGIEMGVEHRDLREALVRFARHDRCQNIMRNHELRVLKSRALALGVLSAGDMPDVGPLEDDSTEMAKILKEAEACGIPSPR